jgi:predicted ArsR family transcriptional regulator
MLIMSTTPELGDPKRRLVDHLKRSAPCTTRDLGEVLAVTDPAVRIHLTELEERGLIVGETAAPTGRGRPKMLWALTPLARELFPDHHDDLTVELISAIRSALGEQALQAVIEERGRRQLLSMSARLGDEQDLQTRVELLAEQRSAEGYMAEVRSDGDALLLIEHHCPVCTAATACQQMCSSELDLFNNALGEDVHVERTDHLLSGDARCTYSIRRR